MKKRLFFLPVVMAMAMTVYAQEDTIQEDKPVEKGVAVNLNIGNYGIGSNLPGDDIYSLEGIITLLNVGVEHRKTNIGIEFSPFKYFFWREGDDKKDAFSVLNFNLHWNILNLNFGDGVVFFGPFTSINYLFFENKNFYTDRYILTAGAQLGFRIKMGGINYNLLSVEAGYRFIDGQHRYFVGVKGDIIAGLISLVIINSIFRY